MNLNRAYRLIILAIIGIWGSSCEKTLSFDLGHDPLIVVQGMILEGEKASVDLHLSQARNSATGYKKVSDAIVTINSGSMMEVLKEEAPGKYYGEQLLGQAGQTYLLEIEWDKGIVSGMATMPEFHFHIDSLEFQRGETENRLKLWLSKSANAQFGIIRIYNEGNSITDNDFLFTDESEIRIEKTVSIESIVAPGSIIIAEILTVEQPLYDYFSNLQKVQESINLSGLTVAPPPDLPNQFSGNALGFFGAMVSDTMRIVAN